MTTKKSDDLGNDEVQTKVDTETEQGFRGVKVDPVPDEEYTLTTGPNSPSYFEDEHSRAPQHSTNPKAN